MYLLGNNLNVHTKAGRTHTDKIGVGAGTDIGGTGISCNFIARQYTGPTRQSYRDDMSVRCRRPPR